MTSSSMSSAVPAAAAERELSLVNITAGYGTHAVVFDVNLNFAPGTISCLIGPNGAGKSTVLKAMFGDARMFAGEVFLGDEEVRPTGRDLVPRGVSYVPQQANVFPSLTVAENLEIGAYVRQGHGGVDHVLALFPELRDLLRRHASKLSGGQQRMVAIGRALMSGPDFLLLDEATSGLAPAVAQTLWRRLSQLAATGVGVIAVEQNVDTALELASEVSILVSGSIAFSGGVADVTPELLEDAFLGSAPRVEPEAESSDADAARNGELGVPENTNDGGDRPA